MSERPKLLPADPPTIVLGETRIVFERFDYNVTHAHIMNTEAAAAMIETSRNQFAIPAQEATKQATEITRQSQEETRRFKYRAFMYPPVLAVGVIAMAMAENGSAKWIAIAIVGVLGSVEGIQFLDRWLSKRRK